MVFRKPYALLIKHFKKIHIVLLVLCAFIFFKSMQLNSFLNEFINYLSYDPMVEPITKYASLLFYISIFVVIGISLSLLILLKKKEKPWKLYLVPVAGYIVTLFVFIWAQSYFASYDGELAKKTATTIAGILMVGTIPQYATFIILFIRITGLDINKFSFKNDEEFLELEQSDREEFEVNVNIDKYAFKRKYKKVLRLATYFYEEHKLFMNIVFTVVGVFFIYSVINFGLAHRTIKETNTLSANGYEITVNKSYYTNKDKKGKVLEKDSSFVVLNLTVKNNSIERSLNTSNFHIVSGRHDYTFTNSTYSNDFNDIGKPYSKRMFRKGETRTFAMIFKVDKKLNKDSFVLYYQEYKSGSNVYLRKLKLKLDDKSKIENVDVKNVGEDLKVTYPNGDEKSFTIDSFDFETSVNYNIDSCDSNDRCRVTSKNYNAKDGYKILKIDFSSSDFEGKELIDFSTNYGKIKYKDNDNLTRSIDIVNALNDKDYLGKVIYIRVPNNIKESKSVTLIYVLRNKKYLYNIK